MSENYKGPIWFRLIVAACFSFIGFGVTATIIFVPARILGRRIGDIDYIVFWPSIFIALVLAAVILFGPHDIIDTSVSEPSRPHSKSPRNTRLSENKRKIKCLKDELESEKNISELEQQLMAERRLREKYKKMALGDD